MNNRINYYWRIFATGLGFFLFGIGGLILRFMVFPFLQSQKIARHTIRLTFRGFIEIMNFLGVFSYKISGLERLERQGLLIIANHPTLIDTVFLMAFVKDADCIVKSSLWQNPFTRGPILAAGYIRHSEGSGLIDNCMASLKQGHNLIIFPEGTRSRQHGVVQFKRGAANLAIRYSHDITPVVIKCEPLMLGKGEKWWKVPSSIARFTIEVGEDIQVKHFLTKAVNTPLAARKFTAYLEHYFMDANNHNANT